MNKKAALIAFAFALVLLCVCVVAFVPSLLNIGTPFVPGGLQTPTTTQADWYELYFTDPKYPDDPKTHKAGLDAKLVALIDKAGKTLDVADYDFDLADVADAMVRAKQRNVRVRMVTDSDTLNNVKDQAVQAAFGKLKKANIPIVEDDRQPIMHHKFTVVDGQWVSTGSWNYTDGDTYRLNNNMVIIQSPELATNYAEEFEKMFTQRKFGPNKPKGVSYPRLELGGAVIENYFAPGDEVADRIIARIRRAQNSVYFMAFSFTHDGIGKEIRDKAKTRLTVSGVFETTGSSTQFSEYGRMKAEGLDVYQDGNPYTMHHKVIILDEETVIFGSFNFSENADSSNDENLLIVDDEGMARAFKAEFDRVLARAKAK